MCECVQLTDKLVEKIGVQRTPTANPEMYKTDDYSAHLKGDNRTIMQREREEAGKIWLPVLYTVMLLHAIYHRPGRISLKATMAFMITQLQAALMLVFQYLASAH